MSELTKKQFFALEWLYGMGGSVLETQIEETDTKDVIMGYTIPGLPTYRKLDKAGLVIITDEEPDETGFTWTPMVALTETGRQAYFEKLAQQ